MVGFRAAVVAGAQWLETDIQFSRDAQPILYHDATLARTSHADGAPWDHDEEQLCGMVAPQRDRFGESFADEPIPTLAQFVAWTLPQQDLRLLIELKEETLARFGVDQTVSTVAQILAPIMDRCTIISRDVVCLQLAREKVTARIGWVLPKWNEGNHRRAQQLAPELMIVNTKRLPSDGSRWAGTWDWMVYVVDDIARVHQLTEAGIHLIETNGVGDLIQQLPPGDAAR